MNHRTAILDHVPVIDVAATDGDVEITAELGYMQPAIDCLLRIGRWDENSSQADNDDDRPNSTRAPTSGRGTRWSWSLHRFVQIRHREPDDSLLPVAASTIQSLSEAASLRSALLIFVAACAHDACTGRGHGRAEPTRVVAVVARGCEKMLRLWHTGS
jgi:hypothetical protein